MQSEEADTAQHDHLRRPGLPRIPTPRDINAKVAFPLRRQKMTNKRGTGQEMKKTTDSGKDNCREMYVETRRQMRKQGRGRKLGPHTHTHTLGKELKRCTAGERD